MFAPHPVPSALILHTLDFHTSAPLPLANTFRGNGQQGSMCFTRQNCEQMDLVILRLCPPVRDLWHCEVHDPDLGDHSAEQHAGQDQANHAKSDPESRFHRHEGRFATIHAPVWWGALRFGPWKR